MQCVIFEIWGDMHTHRKFPFFGYTVALHNGQVDQYGSLELGWLTE